MQLIHPETKITANVHVVGTGTIIWYAAPEDNGDPIEEPALGIWADPDRFFRVRLLPEDDLVELSLQVFQGLIPRLEREFIESPLPKPGEASGLHGRCKIVPTVYERGAK